MKPTFTKIYGERRCPKQQRIREAKVKNATIVCSGDKTESEYRHTREGFKNK